METKANENVFELVGATIVDAPNKDELVVIKDGKKYRITALNGELRIDADEYVDQMGAYFEYQELE